MDLKLILLTAFSVVMVVVFAPGCHGRVVKSRNDNSNLDGEDEIETIVERLEKLVESSRHETRGTHRFTDAQKSQALYKHNQLRKNEGGSGMHKLVWNSKLEDLAQDWANGCAWGHRPPNSNQVSEFGFTVGENIWAWGEDNPSLIPDRPIQDWFDEKANYQLSTATCNKEPCGHYTALVWASTTDVGCGMKFCKPLQNVNWPNGGLFVVCNYGPAGNEYGKPPYTPGQACTKCASGKFYCSDNLCDKTCNYEGDQGKCSCGARCDHGQLVSSNCSCKCNSGHTGVNCGDVCQDLNPACSSYPSFMCNNVNMIGPDGVKYLNDNCPKLCGICAAKNGGDDEKQLLESLYRKYAQEKRMKVEEDEERMESNFDEIVD